MKMRPAAFAGSATAMNNAGGRPSTTTSQRAARPCGSVTSMPAPIRGRPRLALATSRTATAVRLRPGIPVSSRLATAMPTAPRPANPTRNVLPTPSSGRLRCLYGSVFAVVQQPAASARLAAMIDRLPFRLPDLEPGWVWLVGARPRHPRLLSPLRPPAPPPAHPPLLPPPAGQPVILLRPPRP